MKKFILIALLIISNQLKSQEKSLVNWLSFEKAQKLDSAAHRPFLIDVYTDWCSWCKYMMSTTYSNKSVADFINQNFYAIQLNAEKDDSIKFKGKMFLKKSKTNELAIQLLRGQMSYPTTVFIDRNGTVYPIQGYLDLRDIEPYLVYFSESLENSVSLQDFYIAYQFAYSKQYKEKISKIPDTLKPDTSGVVKWFTFEDFETTKKQEPKKYVVFSYVPWCNSCKVMKKITFSNNVIAKILNENFTLIEFDASSSQTYTVNGKQYKSLGQGQPNELAMELFQKQFSFPALFFLDENFMPITQIRGYASPNFLEQVLKYVQTNSYKTQKFEEFVKNYKSVIK